MQPWKPLAPGKILSQRYRVERLIGSGGMGAVYRANDLMRNKLCAVKVLHHFAAREQELCRRFLAEAYEMHGLVHDHIVQVLNLGQDPDGEPYYVMEYLQGHDLARELKAQPQLPLERVLTILWEVGTALSYAHANRIIHRDVKPQNIFLHQLRTDTGRMLEVVKLIDFGFAKLKGRAGRPATLDNLIFGTPQYTAPELLRYGSATADERSDQWSLGVVGYLMLSGTLPIEPASPAERPVETAARMLAEPITPLKQRRPELPTHVLTAIDRSLSRDRAARFDNIEAFLLCLANRSDPLSSTLWPFEERACVPRTTSVEIVQRIVTPQRLDDPLKQEPPEYVSYRIERNDSIRSSSPSPSTHILRRELGYLLGGCLGFALVGISRIWINEWPRSPFTRSELPAPAQTSTASPTPAHPAAAEVVGPPDVELRAETKRSTDFTPSVCSAAAPVPPVPAYAPSGRAKREARPSVASEKICGRERSRRAVQMAARQAEPVAPAAGRSAKAAANSTHPHSAEEPPIAESPIRRIQIVD